MKNIKPSLRWLAVTGAAGALALAFLAPHHQDTQPVPDDSPPPAGLTSNGTPAASPSPVQVAVYVCGAVRKTGVYRLSAGSRVVDAVNSAGGLSDAADAEAVNLAAPLVDGMKVDVPRKDSGLGPSDLGARSSLPPSSRAGSRHRSSGRSGSHKLQPGQTLDVNSATEAELTQLPGVGPSLARRIVEYREANGPFQTIDDLQNVSGIGPSKFAKMEAFVRV